MGNVYQIAEISVMYFSYGLATQVKVAFPDTFRLPKMSICFYTSNLIKWDQELKDNPLMRNLYGFSNMTSEEIAKKVSRMALKDKMVVDHVFVSNKTGDQLFNRIIGWKDIFDGCSILSPVDYTVKYHPNCSDIYKIQIFMKECYVCYAFMLRQGRSDLYDYSSTHRVAGLNGFQNAMFMKESSLERIDQIKITLNKMDRFPRLGFTRNIFLSQLQNLIVMTYTWFKNDYLPDPYPTGCIDYTNIGYTERAQCFERCFRNESLKKLNKIIPGGIIRAPGMGSDEPAKHTQFTTQDVRTSSLASLTRDIQKKCSKQCKRPDCTEEQHIPVLMSKSPYAYNCLLMNSMQAPAVETVYAPKFSLTEYLTDSMSTIGFWVGISFLSALNFFTRHISSLFVKMHENRIKKSAITQILSCQPKKNIITHGTFRIERRRLDVRKNCKLPRVVT